MISQLRGLTDHSICWWIQRHRATDRTETTLSESFHFILFLLLKYFPSLSSFPVRLLLQMHACCTSPPSLPSKAVGFLHSQRVENRSEGKGGREGVLRLEQGFMTFSTICIIVCISCRVSTQCQHGWSVLISKLHHKDKRNTCRYKVILLPTAHVKLFRRTRHSRSYCSCMNGQIIASWFLKTKESNSNWSGRFIVGS